MYTDKINPNHPEGRLLISVISVHYSSLLATIIISAPGPKPAAVQ